MKSLSTPPVKFCVWSKFAPAALLALKAKRFDDGLYACVEMAADTGLGRLAARKDSPQASSGGSKC
jgi:hypothetical protein